MTYDTVVPLKLLRKEFKLAIGITDIERDVDYGEGKRQLWKTKARGQQNLP